MSTEQGKRKYQRMKDRILVSELLGRQLERLEQVHHHPDDSLILCKDQAQHSLIHLEINALKACGFKDWRKCKYCGEYDDPSNLYISKQGARHRICIWLYTKEWLKRSIGSKEPVIVCREQYARYAPTLGMTGAA